MKCKVVPLRFDSVIPDEYDRQLDAIRFLYGAEVELLPSIRVGEPVPQEAQAAVFPIVVGEAYRCLEDLRKIRLPIVLITSPYGTMAMWDWEILTFFRSEGLEVFAPYDPELARVFFRTVSLKSVMSGSRFLVFQDTPGDGMQADIFKRFFWWEPECTRRIRDRFGIEIVTRSYRALGERARSISDEQAGLEALRHGLPEDPSMTEPMRLAAYKLYMAICEELDQMERVIGIGANCLNESFCCDSTPCLAWNLLYKERGLVWSCEGDTMSLLTQYLLDQTVRKPMMMTNIYPFLVGMAALSHEKIREFPTVADPDDHALLVHCGYFGFVPQCHATRWSLKEKVLEIVGPAAHMIDAEMGTGPVTLAKLHSSFDRLFVCDAVLEQYVQYPGSDCRNGGLIRVKDGHALVDRLYSHHVSVLSGKQMDALNWISRLLDLTVERC